ncbi:polysaccharide deacetylase family protein, partial [Staphylococcus aureus]|nr:polysaccharide deacetylase family protein [Staphylococcus aureus]
PSRLKWFRESNIKTSLFMPGHTVYTFPGISKAIFDAGHEIAHHGYYHENPTLVNRDTERRLMDLAFACYKRHFGIRPVGYRSPYWDYSENTLDLLEEAGFLYDSSLMARDLVPYHRQGWQVTCETGNIADSASAGLGIPVSWYLHAFPALAHTGQQAG